MRILITNDDGIYADGIALLVEWAKGLGEVTVAAPRVEQSGKSHAINFTAPVEIRKVDVFGEIEAYEVDSTPADCVRFATNGLGRKYDLVLSGINRGMNIGTDIVYSGTVAAIFEAGQFGHRAIAFSTSHDGLPDAAKHLDNAYNFIVENNLFDTNPIYNVNIPADADGIRLTRQGNAYFTDRFEHIEGDFYIQRGEYLPDANLADESIDSSAIAAGKISVTPMSIGRTDMRAFEALKGLNN